LGGAQEYYGITPDLCTLGKILGGGLPVSAVAGKSEIMSLADVTNKSKTERCWIGGGTFSENSLCMKTGIATLDHLSRNRKTIYRNLSKLGEDLRKAVDKTFAKQGIRTSSTGAGSLFTTHFLGEDQSGVASPSDVSASNKEAQHRYYFSLIAWDGIYFIPGHLGAVSTAHSRADIDAYIAATERYAKSQ